MSWTYRNSTAGDFIFGSSSRSIARAKLLAVTGAPLLLNRKPRLSVNVYVLQSGEIFG